jgi:ankyrin repeat protein
LYTSLSKKQIQLFSINQIKNDRMKKSIALCLFLFTIVYTQAQEITKDTYLAFKNDNVSALKSQLDMTQLNECYAVKDSSYALLALAIKMNATNSLSHLLSQEGIDVNKACSGKTPLMYTAKYGKLEMLKMLLNAGANRKLQNEGQDVLAYAKKYKQQKIVNYLMSE